MKKKYVLIGWVFSLFFFSQLAFSQSYSAKEVRQILDKVSANIKKANPLSSSFTVSQYNGKSQTSSTSGTFCLKGNKYTISSEQAKVWYDGSTQWVLPASGDEVNVSTPEKAQVQWANPYCFIDLYKKGYSYTASSENVRGVKCHSIRLQATGNQTIREVLLSVNAQTFFPVCVRVRQGASSWTRISILSVKKNQKFSDALFSFPQKEYPNVEVNDLR